MDSYVQEYSSLNTTMDEIDSFMDTLEQKTDNLYSELKQLLEDNKKARLSFTSDTAANDDSEQIAGEAKSQEMLASLSLHPTDDTTESKKTKSVTFDESTKSLGNNNATTEETKSTLDENSKEENGGEKVESSESQEEQASQCDA